MKNRSLLKRIFISIVMLFVVAISVSTYATNNVTENNINTTNNNINNVTVEEALDSKAAGQIVELKENANKELKDYEEIYGSKSYGIAAYILDKVRIFSIPVCFIGIAVSVIFQNVIGSHRLDARDHGYRMVIGFVTLFVVAQALPLIYALVVKGWGGA